MSDDTTTLTVSPRTELGSRANRRLRRRGLVPGVVYGGDAEPIAFQVGVRDLRSALAHAGAVITLEVEGAGQTPVVLKEQQRHPVTGETLHVDLMRVDLSQRIHATVPLELTGAEGSPGVRAGGILEHLTREVTVEALPTEIPDVIYHDVSSVEIGDTILLSAVVPPQGVVLLDDGETVVATVSAPRKSGKTDVEIEQETEVVGESGGDSEAAAEGDSDGGE